MQKLLRDFTCLQKPSLAPATLLVPRAQPRYGLVGNIHRDHGHAGVKTFHCVAQFEWNFLPVCRGGRHLEGVTEKTLCFLHSGTWTEQWTLDPKYCPPKRIVTLIWKANKTNYLIVGKSYLDDFSADLTRVNLGQASACCESFNNLDHLVTVWMKYDRNVQIWNGNNMLWLLQKKCLDIIS